MPPFDQRPAMAASRLARSHLALRRTGAWVRGVQWLAALVLLALGTASSAHAWGREVSLVRKYRPGQKMVYAAQMRTRAEVHSDPPALKDLLLPVPTEFRTRQQNTVTVKAVYSDGAADIQNRFDQFEVQSDLAERLPENLRDSAREAQEEFSQRVTGQALVAHYDREGRLLGFEGADEMLQELDSPLREPLRQVLRLFLEQMGGHTLYPGHRVKPGEEWTQKLTSPPRQDYPFNVEGESTLRYAGKTRYHGVKVAIVDFRFQNALTPALDNLRRAGPMAQLEAPGMKLDIRIQGWGQGRVLLALDDGRVLQNRATLHQTLSAQLKGVAGLPLPVAQPARLEIQSETEMEVESAGK